MVKSKAGPGKCGLWQGRDEGRWGRHPLAIKGEGVPRPVLKINIVLLS